MGQNLQKLLQRDSKTPKTINLPNATLSTYNNYISYDHFCHRKRPLMEHDYFLASFMLQKEKDDWPSIITLSIELTNFSVILHGGLKQIRKQIKTGAQ